MADGPNFEQIFRNGQLVWKDVPEHRTMLERYYAFYKNTSDIQVFEAKYPEFLEEMRKLEGIQSDIASAPAAPAADVTEEKADDTASVAPQGTEEAPVEPNKSRSSKKGSKKAPRSSKS